MRYFLGSIYARKKHKPKGFFTSRAANDDSPKKHFGDRLIEAENISDAVAKLERYMDDPMYDDIKKDFDFFTVVGPNIK